MNENRKIIILELKTLNDGRQKEKISKRYRESNLETTNTLNVIFCLFLFVFIDIIVIWQRILQYTYIYIDR